MDELVDPQLIVLLRRLREDVIAGVKVRRYDPIVLDLELLPLHHSLHLLGPGVVEPVGLVSGLVLLEPRLLLELHLLVQQVELVVIVLEVVLRPP